MENKKPNNNFDLLYELVKTSFTLKYHGSVLGFIWVVLKPFLQFLILYTVFSNVGGNETTQSFTIYLLLGLVMFSFFQEGISMGTNALLEKAHIILKVNFNRNLAIFSSLSLSLINFIINFGIVLIFALFNPINITVVSLLYFIFIIFVELILILGVSFFTSIITVKIRDLQHIIEVGMQLLFYASAIFFQIEIVPEPYREILKLNPIFILIDASRHALIYGEIVSIEKVAIIAVISIIILIFGLIFFKSKVKRIAEFF